MGEGFGGVVFEPRVLHVGPLFLLLDIVGQEVEVDGGGRSHGDRKSAAGDAGPLQTVDGPDEGIDQHTPKKANNNTLSPDIAVIVNGSETDDHTRTLASR